jgi:hypothetical protein
VPPATAFPTATPTFDPAYSFLVDLARQDLAGRLPVPFSEVRVASVQPAEWSNRCFDLHRGSLACKGEPFAGYQITLAAGGETYTYRADRSGSLVLADASTEDRGSIWLEMRREDESGVYCDIWQVNRFGTATWNAPCQGKAASRLIYLDIPRILKFEALGNASAPFVLEMEKPAGARVRAYLYGQGSQPLSPVSRAGLLDQVLWFLNPGGEGDPGACDYTSPNFGWTLTYPCTWEPQEESFSRGRSAGEESGDFTLYSPGRGAPYAPPLAKLGIHVYTKGELPSTSLDDLERKLIEEGEVSERAEHASIGGIPALRWTGIGELGVPFLTYYLIHNERVYGLSAGYDIQAGEAILKTFRP